MKKRIDAKSPLKLHRETLRSLTGAELANAAGGSFQIVLDSFACVVDVVAPHPNPSIGGVNCLPSIFIPKGDSGP